MANGRRLVMVDDSNPQIQFNGPWFFDSSGSQDNFGNYGGVYNKTQHGTVESASLSFTYTGSYFAVMGSNLIRNDSGVVDPQWDCFLDGVKTKSNPFEFDENNWWLCYPEETTTVDDGPHILTVNATVSKSQTFWVDRIDYVPSPSVPLADKTIFVDHNDPEVQFGFGWQANGDTSNITRTSGTRLSFSFEGTSISWFSYRIGASRDGSATWSVDNNAPTAFTVKAVTDGPVQYNQELFRTPDYPPGRHQLSVVYLGPQGSAPLILDYFVVRNSPHISTASPSPSNIVPTSTPSSIGTGIISLGAKKNSNDSMGIVVGAVLGSVALILIVCCSFLYARRRQKTKRSSEEVSPNYNESYGDTTQARSQQFIRAFATESGSYMNPPTLSYLSLPVPPRPQSYDDDPEGYPRHGQETNASSMYLNPGTSAGSTPLWIPSMGQEDNTRHASPTVGTWHARRPRELPPIYTSL